jgi:class 3 adenylate cyclase
VRFRSIPVGISGDVVADAQRRRSNDYQRRQSKRHDADATLVTDIDGETRLAVSTSATKFYDQLGRQPRFFRLCWLDAACAVFQTAVDSESITLQASATANASVEVF